MRWCWCWYWCRNWRRFSIAAIRIGDASPKVHLSSVSASPRKLNPVDHGFPYPAFRVEEWGCRNWRFRVKVYTVQLLKELPRPHSRGLHRCRGFMATIATASLSSLCRKSHSQRIALVDQPQRSLGVLCVSANISQVSVVHYPPTSHRLSKYHTVCWPA